MNRHRPPNMPATPAERVIAAAIEPGPFGRLDRHLPAMEGDRGRRSSAVLRARKILAALDARGLAIVERAQP